MIKAVVFDIDGTLTDDVSWLRLTELLGADVDEHSRIFKEYLNRDIAYEESRRQLIGLWHATGNANRQYMADIFDNYNLRDGARSIVNFCHERGYATVIISGSVDLFAESIARKLNIDNWYANTQLVWNDDNQLVSYHYHRDQATKKLEQFTDFRSSVGVLPEECVVFGDNDNDIKLFEVTKHGIAIGKDSSNLLKVSWKNVDNLAEAQRILAGNTI